MNEAKDKIEFATELIKKISYGLTTMNINSESDCHVSVSDLSNLTFTSTTASDDWVLIKFFLVGDIKGLFQLVGRNCYDSSHCMCCKYRPTLFGKIHMN